MTPPIDPYVEKNLRWNFSVNMIDITFITLGLSLISRETILPLLVSELTDNTIWIGFIPAIFSISYYLPQLFAANRAERMKRKLPFVRFIGGPIERGPYLLIGLSILLFAEDSPGLTLFLLLFFIGMAAFGAGVGTPAWFTMIGKVLPVHRRGIFFGVSEGIGMLMGMVGAFFVGIILEEVAYPLNFASLFLIASVFVWISWIGLILNREPDSPVVKKQVSLPHYFSQLPAILRENHNYRRFMISYAITRLGMMAVGFFIVYGNDTFNLSGTNVGTLTAVLIGSQAAMQLLLGWLSDRIGHKLNLTFSGFALTLATIFTLTATDYTSLIPAFFLLGVAIASDKISRYNILLEFAVPEDQPTFIGLTNTLLAPVTFFGPILAGWLATVVDFRGMFTLAMCFGILGGLLLLFWVQEPRRTPPRPIAAIPD